VSDPVLANAADPAQVADSQADEKSEAEQLQDDLRAVLEMRQGRRVLWRYLSIAGIYRSSFSEKAETTAFNEGRRVIGLTIMGDITSAKPDALIAMMLEAQAEKEERARAAARRAEAVEAE
jgi:hypothetical protein